MIIDPPQLSSTRVPSVSDKRRHTAISESLLHSEKFRRKRPEVRQVGEDDEVRKIPGSRDLQVDVERKN